MSLESVNPTTGERLDTFSETAPDAVARIVADSRRAMARWRRTDLAHRAELLRETADLLRSGREEYAGLMALEMGKPVRQGRAEIDKCAWVCEHTAEHGAELLADRPVPTDARESFVTFQPLGVVLAIMPWNFPFWQVFRFAAPALMAGNGALLKHASNVCGCALAIEKVLHRAGIPRDLFRTLLLPSGRVEEVLAHPDVCAVTLTGSTPAGRAVARRAGELLKKTVLELGGSDPYLILADADLPAAVEACAAGRLLNSGQSCIAAKRFLVVEPLRREFEERLVATMDAARVGDPLDEETELGPLARFDLRQELHRQVSELLAAGARCLLGGELPEGDGAFYPPTVLTDVPAGSPAAREELFGPVAAIFPVADEEEAVRLANAGPFGLGAAVFTRDLARGRRLAREVLEAGSCFVNTFVRSDPRLPFGGVRESGYGRELGAFGIYEFVNIKTVWVA